ncbi:MAG: PA14 domain-containing protein, partial [Patescibacteria group bacterium]
GYVEFVYNRRPAIPVPESPSTNPNQETTVTTTQPTLGVSAVTDPEGDAVKYAYQVQSTTGVILYQTDWFDATRLTIPEGLLQDGGTYKWNFIIGDGYWNSGWQNGGTVRVDLRTGKDKTSTYQDAGPISVSLNTGNAYTDVASHSIKALDGDIGLNLSYNSPLASRIGLRAEYFNNNSWSGDPTVRRVESTIDNNWVGGSPAQDLISVDGFSGRYTGYFIAPESGTYYFGGNNDDYINIVVNGQTLYTNGGCYSGVCYGNSIALTAGQTVSFLT